MTGSTAHRLPLGGHPAGYSRYEALRPLPVGSLPVGSLPVGEDRDRAVARHPSSRAVARHPSSRAVPGQRRRPSARVRRRRTLVVLGTVAVASVLALLGGFPFVGSGEPVASATSHPISYVVQPGDTLWGIVEATHPGTDPRPLVDALDSELHGRPLQPGQVIEVP